MLVVDDEEPLATLIAGYLQRDSFHVTVASDGLAALSAAQQVDPEVVILDLALPSLDGIEVCRQLRTFSDCYVIMLTARGDEVDRLVGLAVGADDYMTKPFSPRELVARVHAVLRRPRRGVDAAPRHPDDPAPLLFGPLTLDQLSREVTLAGQPVPLTRTEFDLLTALASQPRRAFTRRQLIDAVWGVDWVGDEHLVDVHVAHLRRKLDDDAAAPRFIRTVRGVGYRMGAGE